MNRMKNFLAGPVIAVALISGVALIAADPAPAQSDTSTVSADQVAAKNIIW